MNSPPTTQAATLVDRVVDGGYCIGCGACAAVAGSPMTIELGDYGLFQAKLQAGAGDPNLQAQVLAVCPFSGEGSDEDTIGKSLYAQDGVYDPHIGYHLICYAGYVCESEYRDQGSSGGMATWLLCELLRKGFVDGVVHVKPRLPDAQDGRLFTFEVSTTAEDVMDGAKSRYYPVEMSEVFQHIRNHPGRYALVGVPCFIKAARLLARADREMSTRICFCVALFCGHLKSAAFAEFLSWQCDMLPEQLHAIDFRKKIADRRASDYGVQVDGLIGEKQVTRTAPVAELYGTSWGLGFFKYQACDYCDDVVGETADVSCGDAWLPKYNGDSRGTNIVVVRNKVIHELILDAVNNGRLCLEKIDPDAVYQSQAGGFRHRRDGLSYRLYLADKAGRWRPPKRVAAQSHWTHRRLRKIWALRMELAKQSHPAWKEAVAKKDFQWFVRRMGPLIRRYQGCYRPTILSNVRQRMPRFVRRGARLALNSLRRVVYWSSGR